MDIYNKETVVKTIRFDKKLVETIEAIAQTSERDFSSQVRYMLREYLKIKEITS